MMYYINIVLARNVWPPSEKNHPRTRDVTRNATRSDAARSLIAPGHNGHLTILT